MVDARIFASVFHRILDFKAGLDFYPGPFFFASNLFKALFSASSHT